MKAPQSSAGQFALMFISQFISFFVIVANIRAFTRDLYGWTALTDGLIVAQNFAVAKLMMQDEKARTWWAGAGATVGGVCGSLCSIWVTKRLF